MMICGTLARSKKKLQVGADLGQRMCNAFEAGLKMDMKKIVIMGSDLIALKVLISTKQ
jgi:hypothetical protein